MNLAAALHPDVAVLDITMPNLNGIEAARQITEKQPHVAIVVLSMHADESYVLRALKAGARGYLLKESTGIGLRDRPYGRSTKASPFSVRLSAAS